MIGNKSFHKNKLVSTITTGNTKKKKLHTNKNKSKKIIFYSYEFGDFKKFNNLNGFVADGIEVPRKNLFFFNKVINFIMK